MALCFMQIGAVVPVVGGVPLALAYKAASTLIQWLAISAVYSFRVVQCATGGWADLVALSVNGHPGAYVWQTPARLASCRRDAIKDPVPILE